MKGRRVEFLLYGQEDKPENRRQGRVIDRQRRGSYFIIVEDETNELHSLNMQWIKKLLPG